MWFQVKPTCCVAYICDLNLPPISAFPNFCLDASSSVIYNLYGFTRVSKHARTIDFTRLFTKRFLLFSRICETRKTMKTRGWNGRVVFIALSVLQFQENNEYRLVKQSSEFDCSQVFGNPGGTRATS